MSSVKRKSRLMTFKDAINIIFKLAFDNAMKPTHFDKKKEFQLYRQALMQHEALAIVHDFIKNIEIIEVDKNPYVSRMQEKTSRRKS